jgi:hypothetical protein
VNAVTNFRIPQNAGNFFISWETVSFSRRILLHGVSIYILLLSVTCFIKCYLFIYSIRTRLFDPISFIFVLHWACFQFSWFIFHSFTFCLLLCSFFILSIIFRPKIQYRN